MSKTSDLLDKKLDEQKYNMWVALLAVQRDIVIQGIEEDSGGSEDAASKVNNVLKEITNV